MIHGDLTRWRSLQIEYIWVSAHFLGSIIYFNMVAGQALDTDIHIVRSCVYPGHLHDPVLGLIIVNFQGSLWRAMCCHVRLCLLRHKLIDA